jgi:phenylacetate-CoA ligase/benzoylacetate-CoA ligase
MEHWNAELEAMPWRDVERWQADRSTRSCPRCAALAPVRASARRRVAPRSRARRPAHAAVHDQGRPAHGAGRRERAATVRRQPGRRLDAIVQALSSSGTTGRPLYYALTARDVETFADAIATVWFTAGIRRDDVVAHLVGLPMVAGGLPYADGFRRVGATLCWLGGFRPSASSPTCDACARPRCSRRRRSRSTWPSAGTTPVARTPIASSLKKVLGGGEPGLHHAEIRARIGHGLGGADVRETMGLGDVLPSMWGECERHDGMHFCAQRSVAVELVDPESGDCGRLAGRRDRRDSSTRRSRATRLRSSATARATTRSSPESAALAGGRARGSAASAVPTTC